MLRYFDLVVLRHGLESGENLGMACLVSRLPSRSALQKTFEFAQVVHAQAVEIAPTGDAEQVVDDHGGVAFAGQALVPAELFGSGFGFVPVVIGVEQFHQCLAVVQLGSGFCLSGEKRAFKDLFKGGGR